MKVLVIGSGGREHALCWAIGKSPILNMLFCAPGNGGIKNVAKCVDISPDNIPAIVDFATSEEIDLVVIGPEAPLVAGLANCLEASGIRVFGPNANAAMIEGFNPKASLDRKTTIMSGGKCCTFRYTFDET